MLFVGDQASLVLDGAVCASDNQANSESAALEGTASFAYVAAGGSVAIAAAAAVRIDGPGPDVFIEDQQAPWQAGEFFCDGSSPITSWQPGAYSITGNTCACSRAFEQTPPQSRTCDACGRVGYNASLCDCGVRGQFAQPALPSIQSVLRVLCNTACGNGTFNQVLLFSQPNPLDHHTDACCCVVVAVMQPAADVRVEFGVSPASGLLGSNFTVAVSM